MLEEIRKNYIKEAIIVEPNWQKIDVNTLCNLYVKYEKDEGKRSGYFACILLKKWGYIGRHYVDSKASGFSIDNCYDMVVDAICYILNTKSWLDPKKAVYGDPQGPDKCLNMGIWSTRRRYYYLANMDKRKCNFGKWSLDMLQENVGDHSEVLGANFMQDEDSEYEINLRFCISNLFKQNRIIEGLVIDNICNDDCFSVKKEKNKKVSDVFKMSKLVNNLYNYDSEMLKKIANRYSVSETLLTDFVPVLNGNKSVLSRIVAKTIEKMGADTSLKEALCY